VTPTPLPAGTPGARPPRPPRKWPWYRPILRNWRRYYLRQFPRKKKLHGSWLHRLLGNRLFDPGLWLPTRDTVAWGMFIGVFIGLLPFLGLQIALSVMLCFAFRVNVTAAVLATFISNPFTAGPILAAQLYVGKWMVGPVDPAELASYTGAIKYWVSYGKPIMFGATLTAAVSAVVAYLLTLLLWSGGKAIAGKAIAVHHAHKHAHEHEHEDPHADAAGQAGEAAPGPASVESGDDVSDAAPGDRSTPQAPPGRAGESAAGA
jgi:uncharacterized protein (DUF2062 family)